MTLTTSALALLALVRAYGGGTVFYAGNAGVANSSYGDYEVLDARGTAIAAIVDIAGDTVSGDTVQDGGVAYGVQGNYQEMHSLVVTIAYKRGVELGGDGATKQALTTLVDALKAHLVLYQRLNGAVSVRRALPVRTIKPYEIAPSEPNDAPSTHLAQDIFVGVWCETTPNLVETPY